MRQYILIIVAFLVFLGCANKPLQNRDFVIKHKALPTYPFKAVKDKIEGTVEMTFDLNENGKPINIKVINANPKKLFNKSAVECLSKWRYYPKVVNGKAVPVKDLKLTLNFRLNYKQN